MAKVLNLPHPEPPPKRSRQEWCLLYCDGELQQHEYASGGGIFRLMRIADVSKSDIASVQAFDKLAAIADLKHAAKPNHVHKIVVNADLAGPAASQAG